MGLGEWWAAAQRMPGCARRTPRPGPASVAYVRRRRGARVRPAAGKAVVGNRRASRVPCAVHVSHMCDMCSGRALAFGVRRGVRRVARRMRTLTSCRRSRCAATRRRTVHGGARVEHGARRAVDSGVGRPAVRARTCVTHARDMVRAVHGGHPSPLALLHVVHVYPAAAIHMRRLQALGLVAVHGAACAVPTTRPAARGMRALLHALPPLCTHPPYTPAACCCACCTFAAARTRSRLSFALSGL